MHIVINTFKVTFGLIVIGVCIAGLFVIMKSERRKERRNERIQRSYLRYSPKRRGGYS